MNIPELFFQHNQTGIDLERGEELRQTPLPQGYLTDIAKVNVYEAQVLPLSLLVQAGIAVKNAEVLQISSSSESQLSAITFSCDRNEFKVRELVLILNSKLQVLTRGTVLAVKEASIKILPETELDDFQHYIIVKCGSEIVHYRAIQMLRTIRTESYPRRYLPDQAKELLGHLFGGKEARQFKMHYGKLDHAFAGLNSSQSYAANLILNAQKGYLIVIYGPPGTGKTTTLATALKEYLLVNQKSRVLISAASNIAVDNLLAKLNFKGALRIGSVARVTQQYCEQFLLDSRIAESYMNELKELQKDVFSLQKQLEKARKQAAKTGSRKELLEVYYELRKANQTMSKASHQYQTEILQNSRLVAATLSGCQSNHMLIAADAEQFDLVVVDEAAYALDINLAAAISHCRGALVLCGDPMQLPPTLLAKESERLWKFSIPVMQKLCAMEEKRFDFVMLDVSYRFGKMINAFPSAAFYGGALTVAQDVTVRFPAIDEDNVVFVDTAGMDLNETSPDENNVLQRLSLKNDGEAQICVRICEQLLQKYGPEEVGVITPYAMQCSELQRMLDAECHRGLEISTVDGFYGREKAVIVMSLVRSNDSGEIGFLDDVRRLNVSITRAKEQLVVIGNSLMFEDKGPIGEWVLWMQDNCSCICASEYQ